eukprot:6186790-Pleurochrysis_carterae.AAC.1
MRSHRRPKCVAGAAQRLERVRDRRIKRNRPKHNRIPPAPAPMSTYFVRVRARICVRICVRACVRMRACACACVRACTEEEQSQRAVYRYEHCMGQASAIGSGRGSKAARTR